MTDKAVQMDMGVVLLGGHGGETLKVLYGYIILKRSSLKHGASLSAMGKSAECARYLWTERWTVDQSDNKPCQSSLSRSGHTQEGVVLGCWHAFNILQHSLLSPSDGREHARLSSPLATASAIVLATYPYSHMYACM